MESESHSELHEIIHADQDYEILDFLAFDGLTNIFRVRIPQTEKILILRQFLHDQFPAGEMVEKYWLRARDFWLRYESQFHSFFSSKFPLKLINAFKNEDGLYFMVFEEYFSIISLKSWFEVKYNTEEYDTKRIIQEILIPLCEQLRIIHDLGIIHRDLTNLTIYVTDEPKSHPLIFSWQSAVEQPKELLYKIPQRIEDAAGSSDEPMGTPGFYAPEVAMLKRNTSTTDIYSLGVLLFYFITGQSRTVENTQEDFQLDLRKIDPSLSPDLMAIVWKMTQFEPINRYICINDFLTDIQNYVNDQPLVHCSPLPPENELEIGLIIETIQDESVFYLPLELNYMNLEQGLHFRFGRELIATLEKPFSEIQTLTETTEQFYLGYSPSKQEFYIFAGHSQNKTTINGQIFPESIWTPIKTTDCIGIEGNPLQIRIGNI